MPTIKDISRISGVSVTQVSRALNNHSDVSQATKLLVHKIAKEIGYAANRSAQNLVMRKSNTLALVLSNIEKSGGKDNIVYSLISGIYEFAESEGFEVVMFTTSSVHQRDKSFLQLCKEQNICGAVINGLRTDDPYYLELLNSEIPCVIIDNRLDGKETSTISCDNTQAAFDAVTFLIENQHREIVMLNGRKEATITAERFKGYTLALEKAGLPLNPELIHYCDFQEQLAFETTKMLIKRRPSITAFFCASDMMAIGALKALQSLEIKVPEQVSIIGFDNIPLAEYMVPPLTTVSQDFNAMGFEAGKQLVKMIKHEPYKKNVILPHNLLVRKSVRML